MLAPLFFAIVATIAIGEANSSGLPICGLDMYEQCSDAADRLAYVFQNPGSCLANDCNHKPSMGFTSSPDTAAETPYMPAPTPDKRIAFTFKKFKASVCAFKDQMCGCSDPDNCKCSMKEGRFCKQLYRTEFAYFLVVDDNPAEQPATTEVPDNVPEMSTSPPVTRHPYYFPNHKPKQRYPPHNHQPYHKPQYKPPHEAYYQYPPHNHHDTYPKYFHPPKSNGYQPPSNNHYYQPEKSPPPTAPPAASPPPPPTTNDPTIYHFQGFNHPNAGQDNEGMYSIPSAGERSLNFLGGGAGILSGLVSGGDDDKKGSGLLKNLLMYQMMNQHRGPQKNSHWDGKHVPNSYQHHGKPFLHGPHQPQGLPFLHGLPQQAPENPNSPEVGQHFDPKVFMYMLAKNGGGDNKLLMKLLPFVGPNNKSKYRLKLQPLYVKVPNGCSCQDRKEPSELEKLMKFFLMFMGRSA